jgi:Tfp pilus assembly protein PilW
MKKQTDKRATRARAASGEAGFSLVELMVALGVTLVIMVVASRMLAMTMAVRTRENQRTESLADVQRALQAMTREISNAGIGLSNNGLVDDDSEVDTIRVRSNLDAFCGASGGCDADTTDDGEDVVFSIISNNTNGDNQRLITRQDVSSGKISPLANRVDGLNFDYLKADGTTAATPSAADRIKITVSVILPAVGSPGAPGYQPPTRTQLVSEGVLRNRLLKQ